MHASLFSLVTVDDPGVVFAWGMEIVGDRDGEECRKTVVHVGGPGGQGAISTHESAEKACARWSAVVPLDLRWDVDDWIDATRLVAGWSAGEHRADR